MALVEAIVASKLARWSGGHVFESLSKLGFFFTDPGFRGPRLLIGAPYTQYINVEERDTLLYLICTVSNI